MDVNSALSNDQFAVLACFGALAACGLIAAVTFHFGPAGKKSTQQHPSLKISRTTGESRQDDQKRAA